ncbi:hypothetical protein CONCODRAFT_68160 [Conidiobolus coronatus NRRL 28638]|uniref:Jacalin-type lectin domain-containing protein n=1 Tax=Conidiobolus coronatus (strain ATCC 28846 / CBS 209.66 / NRRL 28638) TaxID=796925 RepID=A0A137PF77_CONC2|nr:hypothetical protein CONCODRAFT_68160 [Conidiobolus coronatus NRRL 28638]|eukprot:KXN73625.1 hypothetical protein CONCODRAFT_68160 [Conidiobolus coronatus NRRL 28638]
MSIRIYNVNDGEILHQRCVLVQGVVNDNQNEEGEIEFDIGQQFEVTKWPVYKSHFKGLLMLEPGQNQVKFSFKNFPKTTVNLTYSPLLQNPPLYLAILVGSDSEGVFDIPPEYGGNNDLEAAKEKLRMAGYLWQAFTAEQLYRKGYGKRTFRLDEGYQIDTLTRGDKENKVMRQTANVRIIRSKKTTEELRYCGAPYENDPKYETGKERPTLFTIMAEELQNYGHPFKQPCTVAGLLLDSKWDPAIGTTRAHTALGGGGGDHFLGVFGSHCTHAWPSQLEDVVRCFSDTTPIDQRYLNDERHGQGKHLDACNIGIGAMLHEVGHSLGLMHTPTGIMFRGFEDLHRSFLSRCPLDNKTLLTYDKEEGSHWHDANICKLRYHPMLRHPYDLFIPTELQHIRPSFNVLDNNKISISAVLPIACIILEAEGLSLAYLDFNKQPAMNPELDLLQICRDNGWDGEKKISVEAVCVNFNSANVGDLTKFINDAKFNIPGYGFPLFRGMKLGGGGEEKLTEADLLFLGHHEPVSKVVVNAGGLIDSIAFHTPSNSCVARAGGNGGEYHELVMEPNEMITKVDVRAGWWIDGLEIFTSSGRSTGWCGGSGGELHSLEAPPNHHIVGFYIGFNDLVKSFGIVYAKF